MESKTNIKVNLLGSTEDPIAVLYSAFRVCYSKDDAVETWNKIHSGKIARETMEKFVTEKLGTGHTSPIRQTQFIFVVDNISRACTAQFNRHHIGLEREEMSQRYVNFSKGINAFITPPEFEKNAEVIGKWEAHQHQCIEFYNFCVEQGMKQEDARFGLPMGTVSREQFCMGLQAMQQFLDVRMCERAQWEIRDMAWQIFRLMRQHHPEISKTLGIKCWKNRKGYCDEGMSAYNNCDWSKTRPHKNIMETLWKEFRNKKIPSEDHTYSHALMNTKNKED